MKKFIYTIVFILGALTSGQAQKVLLQSSDEMAGIALVGEDMLLITRKEDGGQYLYTARRSNPEVTQRAAALNAGEVNAVVGGDLANGEVFVYHKSGRRAEKIRVYKWSNGAFEKGKELPVPRMRNHSYNLGMFLSEDQQRLFIAAELADSRGYDDLYLSEWDGKTWSKPKNLGSQVNSRGVEFAPFMSGDSLYFSRLQEETAYVYVASLQEGQPGEAVRLQGPFNERGKYNAYFRKNATHTVWISAAADSQPRYTAYLLGESPAEAAPLVVAVAQVEEEMPASAVDEVAGAIASKEVATPVRAAAPSLVLYNAFNHVHLSQKELAGLSRFLRQLPNGASFVVKGYSDGYGAPAVKQRVSEQRATSVKNFIRRNFADKGFKVDLESEVLPDKGKAHRKTELYLLP